MFRWTKIVEFSKILAVLFLDDGPCSKVTWTGHGLWQEGTRVHRSTVSLLLGRVRECSNRGALLRLLRVLVLAVASAISASRWSVDIPVEGRTGEFLRRKCTI